MRSRVSCTNISNATKAVFRKLISILDLCRFGKVWFFYFVLWLKKQLRCDLGKSWPTRQQRYSANFTFHLSFSKSRNMFKSAIAYPASCCFLGALDSPVSQKQSAAIRASSSFWSLFYFNLRWAMSRVPFTDIFVSDIFFQMYIFQIYQFAMGNGQSPFFRYILANQPLCQGWQWPGLSSNQGPAVGQICNETVNIRRQWNGQHLTIKKSTVSPEIDSIMTIDQSTVPFLILLNNAVFIYEDHCFCLIIKAIFWPKTSLSRIRPGGEVFRKFKALLIGNEN